jgi:ornithine carbamoyltransferase
MNATAPPQIHKEILKAAASDFACDLDLTPAELASLLDLADDLKREPRHYLDAARGKSIALLFEKPSLRTRLTFELAIQQMGGSSAASEGPIGIREPLKDVARNLDRWVDVIVARVFSQGTIEELAKRSSVPVINALSDVYHPCQALADLQTLREHFGKLQGLKVAFMGDGNNVAHSLMLCAARTGMTFALARPKGYGPNEAILKQAQELSHKIEVTSDPAEAAAGAHAIYTDVWASMGQENEASVRREIFAPYQVNDDLMSRALPEAVFLHCLPAKRGEEVTDAVIESKRSLVFDQAENRLHTQKALLLMLLKDAGGEGHAAEAAFSRGRRK